MSLMTEIMVYLIQTVTVFYTLLIILRFLLQLAKADFYNPLSQFIVMATNPPLLILRRFIPNVLGVDTAAIILAILVQAFAITAVIFLLNGSLIPAKILTWSLLNIVGLSGKFFFFSILASVILSWVAPRSNQPIVQLIFQINEPLLAPVRRIIPPMGGIDFSSLVVIIALNIINAKIIPSAAISSGMYSIISFGI